MIFINFKSGYEGTGARALALVRKIAEAQKETKIEIIPVVHDFDLYPVRQIWGGELWIQHADLKYGATGMNAPETVVDCHLNIGGTLLNHSEHKYENMEKLGEVVFRCRSFGLKTLIFVEGEEELGQILDLKSPFGKILKPDFIAYEPPELIASTTTSVAKARPEIIAAAAKIAKRAGVPLLVGAGIKDKDDVIKSLELGAVGVVVSSAVLQAVDQKGKILELASGFQ